MALESTFELLDLSIADQVSWTEFVFGNFGSYGDKTAIVDGVSGKSYTYSQLKELTTRCSSALKKRGIKKKDVVAIYCPNIPEYPIIFFAVTLLGGTVTTINPLYTTEELIQQLIDSGSRCLFTIPKFFTAAQKACRRARVIDSNIFVVGKMDGRESLSTLCEDEATDLDATADINTKVDVAFLPYTSGTIGSSKGVMLTHYNLVAGISITSAKGMFDFEKSSVILGVLPFFHSNSMMAVLSLALYQGGKVVCVPSVDQESILSVIQQHKITHAPLVPPIISALLRNPKLEESDLSSLANIFTGASPLTKDTVDKLRLRLPHVRDVRQGYGMTELCPLSHLCPAAIENKPGSVGVLLPNMECKVVCVETGNRLKPNKDGELLVRGPTVMKGYLHNPDATAQAIDSDGWLHTGDFGHYDDDGFFYIVDRLKELVTCRGYHVSPSQLEQLLISHPDIEDAAVIGLPEIGEGEVPKAFVVKRDCDLTEDEVYAFVSGQVACYNNLEGGVEFIQEIPKSISGKILRITLKEKELAQLQSQLEEDSEENSEGETESQTTRNEDVVHTPDLKLKDFTKNDSLTSKNPIQRQHIEARRSDDDSPPIKSSSSCNIV